MTMTHTPEQQAAIDAVATGKNVLIRAGAGTGKTTTLRGIGQAQPDREMLFIAFNVSVKDDAAKSFSRNVTCLTSAGLANRALRHSEHRDLLRKINGPRQSPVDISKILGLPYQAFSYGQASLFGYQVAGIVMQTVTRFCYSADETIGFRHVPRQDGLTPDEQAQLEAYVVPFARKAWADLIDLNGRLSWGRSHDYYFKFWALTHPTLDFDCVMVDEAQDTNPALAALLAEQSCQVVMVGDECQAIYGWRGARDAMQAFGAEHVVNLTQSFRFGPAVAEQANLWLTALDAPLRLQGFDKVASTVGPLDEVDAVLCRTNAAVIENAIAALETGRQVGIVGGVGPIKSFVEAAEKLMSGKRTTHADLAAFKSWSEVVEYANTDEGGDLKVMVRMIENHGVEALKALCADKNVGDAKTAPEGALILSTAHKAKGREWNRVRIASDFKAPEEGAQPSRPEMMLCYVAVTRAKLALDATALAWIEGYVAGYAAAKAGA